VCLFFLFVVDAAFFVLPPFFLSLVVLCTKALSEFLINFRLCSQVNGRRSVNSLTKCFDGNFIRGFSGIGKIEIATNKLILEIG